ncbi:hypothetical protein MMON_44860 [Mycolicibacterium monacense]|uniref:Uncharacterized protein n=1 Tax=Mycolicibacterium monacense TaxID=85693 RepID=A0AAD1J0V7_MYCMB|nr:hypothetical protein MMON_44860 [Mycolicibacterium monacense]
MIAGSAGAAAGSCFGDEHASSIPDVATSAHSPRVQAMGSDTNGSGDAGRCHRVEGDHEEVR